MVGSQLVQGRCVVIVAFVFGKTLGYHSACLLVTPALIELATERKS